MLQKYQSPGAAALLWEHPPCCTVSPVTVNNLHVARRLPALQTLGLPNETFLSALQQLREGLLSEGSWLWPAARMTTLWGQGLLPKSLHGAAVRNLQPWCDCSQDWPAASVLHGTAACA